MRRDERRRRITGGFVDKDDSRPLGFSRQTRGALESNAAGEHAAVGHVAAAMALTGRTVPGAALGADDVAEYVALDGRGGDSEGRLQHEHQRRDESRDARRANPASLLSHGLP